MELVNRRIEGVLALITIVLDFPWERERERGPFPYLLKNSLLQLPRNETSRLEPLLLGYISFSNKLLHFSFRDSVEDNKFVGIGKIDQWYTKLIGLERDSESLIVPAVFFILSMDIVLDFLLFLNCLSTFSVTRSRKLRLLGFVER